VILREKGAAYYAASLPRVYGLPAYPQLRPVAIDAIDSQATLYAGIYQSVLGQIGFRAYTRVYGVKVETISELATWYGTAQVADTLTGVGKLTDMTAEVGGAWQLISGDFERTSKGLIATETNSLAVLKPQATSGLLHLAIACESKLSAALGVVWRFQDQDNYWCCWLEDNRTWVQLVEAGQKQEILVSAKDYLLPQSINYLQILDDSEEIRIYLNGKLISDNFLTDTRLASATGIGMTVFQANAEIYLKDLEAHPRTVTIPDLDLGLPWWREGEEIALQDDFQTWEGDLVGKTTSVGNQIWAKTLGKGAIAISQSGIAKVQANVQNPNPGRTAYTVTWEYPVADVEVTILPPGKERGQGDKGRAGLIFWQDRDNYIIINTWLDDFYEGESISCFFRIAGFEEVYDAVWSNIGKAIAFGQPYTLRVVFDGNNYTVRVNNQTVLYRALTDVYSWTTALKINRLGIVANWEWGDDTGSGFSDFKVRK
jgi:hypothetical protein